MKLNFCTLFNSNYLSRGIVMYESLLKQSKNFHLYVFAFDDKCYQFFRSQHYKNVTVIALGEFEDEELLKVKPTRTAVEYCWTCTSSIILYSIKKYNLDNCTYLDADIQFFADPIILFEEMRENSVLITNHRYTKKYDQSIESGKYCVQFVSFKNDTKGMKVLYSWREACIEWCYARVEDGKFGDQKYLDEWSTRFEGVHELQHLGGGIAPWNVQQYNFKQEGNGIVGIEKSSKKIFNVIFFHFHGLKFYKGEVAYLSDKYELTKEVRILFYIPYINLLNKAKENAGLLDSSFDPHGATVEAPASPFTLYSFIKYYLYDLKKSVKNVLGQKVRTRMLHYYYYKNDDFNS